MKQYIFDISTSARWSGHPVGIIRVERELARRANAHLGNDLAFSVFDLDSNAFLRVRDCYVDAILNGEVAIPTSSKPPPRTPFQRVRDLTLRVPRSYQFLQRLRGFNLSIEEVYSIRKQLANRQSGYTDTDERMKRLTLADLTDGPIALNPHTVVVSGGLDWEYKNLQAIYRSKKQLGFKYVSIVYDLIPVHFPHYVVPLYVPLLTEYFGELQWVSDGYMCISETTRQDLLRFLSDNNISSTSAAVFPLGSDIGKCSDEERLPNNLNGKQFVLYVSTIEPRKNHRTIYEAWCHGLISGTIDPVSDRLVFVGRTGWNVEEFIYEISANPLTANTIVLLENVSDSLLNTLYNQSAAVVFPSFYEGFGLPLAEAFAHGKVCITSAGGALKEIGSPFRIDVDPRDTLGWSRVVSDMLRNPDSRQKIERDIVSQYQRVDWDESATTFFSELRAMARSS